MEATLLVLKATLLLALAFAAATWNRTSPGTRHGVWSVTFVALLALPLLALVLPGIHVPVPSWRADVPAAEQQTNSDAAASLAVSVPAPAGIDVRQRASVTSPPGLRPSYSATQILLTLWLLGAAAALLGLTRSLLRIRRLAASGNDVNRAEWNRSAGRIARRLGLAVEPRLVFSDAVVAPMAGNIGQPTVFLPADAAHWDADRREVVLTHEITHLARRDPLRILAARVACALYWFHPLMWVAARRSTADCEQACDESVLALGIRPSTYARVLLDFAHQAPPPVLSVALPIVQRHRLETRVMSILSNASATSRRANSPRRTFLATLSAIALIAAVAAARPATIEAGSSAIVIPAVVVNPAESHNEPLVPVATAITAVITQRGSCWNEYTNSRSFNGSSSYSNNRFTQRIGRVGRERVAQMTFGDVRVCMITDGYDGPEDNELPSTWIGNADRVVMETERENDVRRLEIVGGRSTWSVNGRPGTIDDGVGTWRRTLLDLLDASWEASTLRGRESSLRGEISSVQGERSSLLGEISSLRGEVSSMQGEISSLRGEESSLRGEISSIRGHESSLRGEISSERGAISSLEAQRWDRASDRDGITARIRRHEDNIRAIEDEIARYDAAGKVRAVERQIAAFDVDAKVAEVEKRLRDFDVERKVQAVERELANLGVERRVRGIEGEIRDLDVDSRVGRIERRRDEALDRLRALLR
jgi:beta-lactamase regulating signal transducer with metallopeptidase domain